MLAVESSPGASSLAAVEGRPAGIVLRLQCENPGAASVELYRVVDEEDPELLQNLAVDDRLGPALREGLELVDSTVVADRRFTYQMFTIGSNGAVLERSNVVDIDWRTPPPRATEVVAVAPFTDAVELSWRPQPGLGVVVFRRDVIQDGRFARVTTLRPGSRAWVDRDVSAAGVWSYRIAFARRDDSGLVQYGAPSEEVYASTPEPQ